VAGPTSKTLLSHSILNVNFDERGLRPSRISLRFLRYHSVQARSTMLIKMQHFFERRERARATRLIARRIESKMRVEGSCRAVRPACGCPIKFASFCLV